MPDHEPVETTAEEPTTGRPWWRHWTVGLAAMLVGAVVGYLLVGVLADAGILTVEFGGPGFLFGRYVLVFGWLLVGVAYPIVENRLKIEDPRVRWALVPVVVWVGHAIISLAFFWPPDGLAGVLGLGSLSYLVGGLVVAGAGVAALAVHEVVLPDQGG